MAVSDILGQYADALQGSARSDARNDYGAVAPVAPPGIVKDALLEAFRAAPSGFPDIASQLFHRANSEQRAGLLRRLLEGAGAGEATQAVLSHVPGGLPDETYQIGARDAAKVKTEQVRELALQAERRSPDIAGIVCAFLVQHPDLVKTLDQGTLTVALHEIAARVRK